MWQDLPDDERERGLSPGISVELVDGDAAEQQPASTLVTHFPTSPLLEFLSHPPPRLGPKKQPGLWCLKPCYGAQNTRRFLVAHKILPFQIYHGGLPFDAPKENVNILPSFYASPSAINCKFLLLAIKWLRCGREIIKCVNNLSPSPSINQYHHCHESYLHHIHHHYGPLS